MADQEQLDLLRRHVGRWNAWRKDHPEIQPDLRDAPLADSYLVSANLAAANLHNAEFSNADLSHADLANANLAGARFTRANLERAWLGRAYLFRAHLKQANLRRTLFRTAQLKFANLIDTNLNGADLSSADLGGADLAGADLRGARLFRANLVDANLVGANLAGAGLFETVVAVLDLCQIEGLAVVAHRGPSRIATSTLERTAATLARDASRQGEIEAFLRGAGVSESYLDTFRLSIGHPIEFYSCFISYSHADKNFARRIYAELQSRGIRCWLDEKDLRPGDVMIDAITDAIRLRDKVLVCCSLASLSSGWVDQELAAAIEIERRERKKTIIPLDLDGYMFDGWEGGKAPLLRERVTADFTGWEHDSAKFEQEFERVVDALRTDERTQDRATSL